jgi:hypothetical protein
MLPIPVPSEGQVTADRNVPFPVTVAVNTWCMFMATATTAGETVTPVIWPRVIATVAVADPPAFVAVRVRVAFQSPPEAGAAPV